MRRQEGYGALLTGGALLMAFLSVSAWFQIQSLRLAYRTSLLNRRLDALDRESQGLERRLQKALSLARLDDVSRRRFGLQVPRPDQIVLLPS